MASGADDEGQERLEPAERFCGMAYLLSIGVADELLDRLGTLSFALAVRKRGLDYWHFFVVAAAAFVALSALEDKVPQTEYESLRARLFRGASGSGDDHFLHLWALNGPSAVEDCADFVQRSLSDVAPQDAKHALCSAVGTWIVWNILGGTPTADDGRLATALGHFIASTYAAYWRAARDA